MSVATMVTRMKLWHYEELEFLARGISLKKIHQTERSLLRNKSFGQFSLHKYRANQNMTTLHSETKQKKIKVIFYCEAQSVFLLLPSSQPVFFTDAQVQNCSQGIFPPQAPCCGGFSYHSPFTFYICVADLFNSFFTQFSNCSRENLLPPSSSFFSRQRLQQNCVLLPGTTFQQTNMSSSIHSTKSLDSKSNRPLTISVEKVTRVLESSNTYMLLSYKCFGR